MNTERSSHSRHLELLLLLFFLLTNLGWIAKDSRPWPVIDCYTMANKVMVAMGRDPSVHVHGPASFLSSLNFGGRPPLYQLCSIPTAAAFGFSEDAFVAVNLLLLALLFFGVYGATRELGGRLAAIVGATATLSFPPIVHILRQYRAYNGAFAGIALALWALLVLIRTRRPRAAWIATAAFTAAVMMHPIAFNVLFVPMASTWIWVFFSRGKGEAVEGSLSIGKVLRNRLRAPLFTQGLFPAIAIPVLGFSAWYLVAGRTSIQRLLRLANVSWLANFRGIGYRSAGFFSVPSDFRWLAFTSPHAISLPLAALVAIASVWILVRGGTRGRLFVIWLGAAYFGVGVFIHILNWQYGAFALPLAGAVLGVGAASLPGRGFRALAVGVILSFSALNYSMVTWGWPILPASMDRILGTMPPHRQLTLCRDAPVVQYFPHRAVMSAIANRTIGAGGKIASVFVVTPPLASATYRFQGLRYWPRLDFRVTGHGSQIWGEPFPFDAFVTSRWLVVRKHIPDGMWQRSEPNFYLRALSRFFQNPPPAFENTHTAAGAFPWPGKGTIVLYRRNRPVSLEEIDSDVEALGLEPRFTTESALTAARILERHGHTTDALQRLDRSLEIELQPAPLRGRILGRSALLLLEAGKPGEAERRAREALRLAPRNADARNVLLRLRDSTHGTR